MPLVARLNKSAGKWWRALQDSNLLPAGEMASRRAPNFPDDLERNFQPLKFIPVDDHLQLKDAMMTVDIYHVIANNHLSEGVFAYIPEHKTYIEADVLTAAEELQMVQKGNWFPGCPPAVK